MGRGSVVGVQLVEARAAHCSLRMKEAALPRAAPVLSRTFLLLLGEQRLACSCVFTLSKTCDSYGVQELSLGILQQFFPRTRWWLFFMTDLSFSS